MKLFSSHAKTINGWNNLPLRRHAGWTCWSIAILAALVAGWANAEATTPGDVIAVLPQWALGAGISASAALMLMGGLFYASGIWEDDGPSVRIFYLPLIAFYICLGSGALVHGVVHRVRPEPDALIAFYGGALALLLTESLHRHSRAVHLRHHSVMRDGTRTEGRVIRVDHAGRNDDAVSRVTVIFNDQSGRQHRARDTIGGHVAIGQAIDVRYLPDLLEKGHGVIIARQY